MNSAPDLHGHEKDEQNKDTGHRSTGQDKKWNKPDSDQNCAHISREAAQTQQKGKTSMCETTLTDVLYTHLKD